MRFGRGAGMVKIESHIAAMIRNRNHVFDLF
jgi:hypothetical protein